MDARIDVVVPGAEGGWIARALRQAGFDVREADDTKGSSDAQAVVVARSLKDFEAAMPELSSSRVVVVSWEPVTDAQAELWGVFAALTRPVAVSKLVDCVRGELPVAKPPTRLSRATLPAPPDEAPPVVIQPVREPTVHLEALPPERPPERPPEPLPPRVPTVHLDDPPPTTGISAIQDTARDSQVVPRPTTAGESIRLDASAEFSPHLDQLMREADRRIFPNEPALDMRFPGGDESAEDLVPDTLLAEVATPLDVTGSDPLEAFTFVGTPDLVHTGAAARSVAGRSEIVSVDDHTPRTVPERGGPSPSESRSTAGSDIAREGMLPPSGAIRVLWQAHDSAEPTELRFELAGGPRVTLVVVEGRLVWFEGPALVEAVSELRRQGRLRAQPDSEDAARIVLDDAVREGQLTRFELGQRIRRARESLISDLIVAAESRFVSRPAPADGPRERIFAEPLIAFVCGAARASVTAEQALRWLRLEPTAKLVLDTAFERRAHEARLEPELVRLFEDGVERAVASLFDGAAAHAGVPGALLSLASADALRFEGSDDRYEVQASAARDRILRAHARSEEGSYFDILGVAPMATGRDVELAHRRRSQELGRLDLRFLGLDELEDLRREALTALDEAAAVLANGRLRAAYASALAAPP